jgi:hypothetical protein
MADENKLAYLANCQDCMPLVTDFPTSCLSVATDAVRAVVTGGTIEDVPCAVHCFQTLQWWGTSQWLVGHVHLKGAAAPAADSAAPADLKGALAELEKAQLKGADVKGLNWALIFTAFLKVLELLKPFVPSA